jgi:hypothetical protein
VSGLVGCLPASICTGSAEHPVEEAAGCGFGLLGRLVVVTIERKRVFELGVSHWSMDMYKGGAAVGIVTLDECLFGLFHEADWRGRPGGAGGTASGRREGGSSRRST